MPALLKLVLGDRTGFIELARWRIRHFVDVVTVVEPLGRVSRTRNAVYVATSTKIMCKIGFERHGISRLAHVKCPLLFCILYLAQVGYAGICL